MTRWFPALCLLTACNAFGGSSSGGQTGELGNGDFFYTCADCAGGDEALPDAIAVGGRFGLSFGIGNDRFPVDSASLALLDESAGTFQAQRAGTFAVLARSGSRIVDILHLEFQDVRAVEFELDGTEADDSVVVTLGDSGELGALPFGSVVLGGELDYMWTVDDPDVIEVAGSGRTVTVTPLGAGSTVVHAETQGVVGDITVVVGGMEPPRRMTATSGVESSTGSDTGDSATDSDTDSTTGGGTTAGTTGGTN